MSLEQAVADRYMTIEEVARRLQIHQHSVRRLRQQGRLHQRLFGSRAWFDREAVERFALTYDNAPGRKPRSRRLL